MIYIIIIAVLTFMLCGDCVFLGVTSQTVLVTFNPSFYWWGIAFYICAGLFGVSFIVYVVRGIVRIRRKKARRGGASQQAAPRFGKNPRGNATNKTRKTPARNHGGQRKGNKRK